MMFSNFFIFLILIMLNNEMFGSVQKEWGHLVRPPALPRSSTLSRTRSRPRAAGLLLPDAQREYKINMQQQNKGIDKS